MEKNNINKLLTLRTELIDKFSRLKDYKNNKNAIIKELEYAKTLHSTIVTIDELLKDHVEFSDKK